MSIEQAIERKHQLQAYQHDAVAVWSAAKHGERAFPLPNLRVGQPNPVQPWGSHPLVLTESELQAQEWLRSNQPTMTASRLRNLFRYFSSAEVAA
jgi:hypothetical protein